jgi:hypothetical protein
MNAPTLHPSAFKATVLAAIALVTLTPARVRAAGNVTDVLEQARPISSLSFQSESSTVLPGKGRGEPSEKTGRLGIALIYAQGNYWTDDRWSARGYDVRVGTLTDAEGRLAAVNAYEISPPNLAANFSFFASGSDLFFEFPSLNDWTVYSVMAKGETAPAGKPMHRFKDHLVIEEAQIPQVSVVAGGFTKIPGMSLHSLTKPRTYFFLPKTVAVRADTEVATGVTAARIAETALGRITTLKIDVSAAGTPENSDAVGRRPGDPYGAKPGMTCFPDEDGGISIVWQSPAGGGLFLTRVRGDLSHSTAPLPRSLGRSSNAARDGEGNFHYVTYTAGSNPRVILVKTSADGSELASSEQNTTPAGLNIAAMSDYWDSVRLTCTGGRLCVIYGRGMDNGHQGSIVVTYATSNLALVRNHGQNSSHSFDSRVVPDGTDFINLSLGDNYPRGLVLHKVRPTSMPGKVIYTYKTAHYPDGLASNDNKTYTELGDLVASPEGYGAIFSSEAGTDNAQATGAMNEARNVGYLLVSRSFETIAQTEYIVPPSMILSPGADSPLFGFHDFGGRYVRQQYRGVRWLTTYTDKNTENASRPKMIVLANGRLILWEKWTPSSYVSTQGTLIDALGNPLVDTTELAGLRLSDGDSAVRSDDRVHGITSNGRELEWSILETDKPLHRNMVVHGHSIDRVSGVVKITIASTVGRSYRLETSTTLASDDWHEVPGTLLQATGGSTLLTGSFLPGGPRRFWRVAEVE